MEKTREQIMALLKKATLEQLHIIRRLLCAIIEENITYYNKREEGKG